MKLLKAHIVHFGSYKDLEFEFNDQGLALIHGNTGSGKSTLQDIPTWCILGVTAKGGNADEVKSWTADGPTKVVLILEYNGIITVHRTRGTPAQNDLYWTEGDDPTEHRGKDIKETQTLLNKRLGISEELYIAASYYNEFSPTGNFFRAKAKDRRALFEGLANLELPAQVAQKTSDAKREAKKEHTEFNTNLSKLQGKLEQLKAQELEWHCRRTKWEDQKTKNIELLTDKSLNFETEKTSKIAALQTKSNKFEADKLKKLDTLAESLAQYDSKLSKADTTKCPTCGNSNEPIEVYKSQITSILEQYESMDQQVNPYIGQIEQVKQVQNTYDEQIASEESKINPFEAHITYINEETIQKEISKVTKEIEAKAKRIEGLERLNTLSYDLRGALLTKAVKDIEERTNEYLETYFDAEIRVDFELQGSDDLNIEIQKSGHTCVYTQLSKGQRCLLKLCFSVAVMKASANKAGVYFDNIFFDEALSGLDPSLKVKAFGLFSELALEHSSVFVVEHSVDLQNLFDKQYHVTLVDDCSNITLT